MKVTLGDHPKMISDLDQLERIYIELGVEVMRIPSKTTDSVFHKDVTAWTPFGLIKCRMGKKSRRWEPDHWFDYLRIKPALVIEEPGTFEGADLLWISTTRAVVAEGNRTNRRGADTVQGFLEGNGVTILRVTLPWWHPQHLLGVANRTPRGELLSVGNFDEYPFTARLPQWEYPRKSPNWVVVGNALVMPDRCPRTAAALRESVTVVETPASELRRYGGGVACATGVIEPC